MAGGASRTARLRCLSAPEPGGRQPRTRHDVNDPLLLAPQKQRTSNPLWVLALLPLPRQSARWTPQRQRIGRCRNSWPQGRRNVADCKQENEPTERTEPAISYTVHTMYPTCPGPTRDGSRGEVEKLAPQYCRPGEPAIANHLPCHEMRHQFSADASDAKNRVPERPWPTSKFARDRSANAATVGFRDAATSTARCCRNSKERCTKRCVAERKGKNDDDHVSEHATSYPTPPPTARHGESWNVMPAVLAIRTDLPAWRCGTKEMLWTEVRQGSSK